MKEKGNISRKLILDTIMNYSQDSIYFKDRECRHILVSKYTLNSMGFNDPSEIIGKTDFDLYSKEHALIAEEDERRIMETGEPVISKLEQDILEDGTEIWVSTSKYPLYDEKGNVIGVWGITRDYTSLKRMERELEKTNIKLHKQIKTSQKMQTAIIEQERLASLGQMIGGIAHSLMSPIMSISGGLEAIMDLAKEYEDSIGDESVTEMDHHEIAKEILAWSQKLKPFCGHMSEVLSTVKEQARLLNETKEGNFTLGEVINRLNISIKYRIPSNTCDIKSDIQTDLQTKMNGDVNSLVQILNNLIVNAIDSYEQKKGVIDFKIIKKVKKIEFIIMDYGKGIPLQIQEKLFKEMITTKGRLGTGLGLYISYAKVKGKFNGDIRFKSEEEKGSTFIVSIPVND